VAAQLNLALTCLEHGFYSLQEVAKLSGFLNEQAFRRTVQSQMNVSPKAYKKSFGVTG